MVRGQGEQTFVEWLDATRRGRPAGLDRRALVEGRRARRATTPTAPFASLDGFPEFPYHKLDDMEEYVIRTYLGERTLCHITSRGCPFPCNFCAITEVYQPPLAGRGARAAWASWSSGSCATTTSTRWSSSTRNFMAAEARALAIAERLRPLGLRWWCQARIDTMNGYSDETWRRLRESGLHMMFFGAESGSDSVLKRMSKQLGTAEILECARRCQQHGIVPEFSFVLGNPVDPERDVEESLGLHAPPEGGRRRAARS